MLLFENLLTDIEVRVLGVLVEKETTTPEYYPLSLNALVNACNQRSNREPVMDLDEAAVRDALHTLGERGLTGTARSDGRVAKFEHRLQDRFNFGRRESAILCVLLLRGAQTPGELRSRTDRLFHFEELADVQSTLQRMIDHDPALVKVLPRAAGTKEARYIQLFGIQGPQTYELVAGASPDRSVALEQQIAELKNQITELREQFAQFRKQFE